MRRGEKYREKNARVVMVDAGTAFLNHRATYDDDIACANSVVQGLPFDVPYRTKLCEVTPIRTNEAV